MNIRDISEVRAAIQELLRKYKIEFNLPPEAKFSIQADLTACCFIAQASVITPDGIRLITPKHRFKIDKNNNDVILNSLDESIRGLMEQYKRDTRSDKQI